MNDKEKEGKRRKEEGSEDTNEVKNDDKQTKKGMKSMEK